MHGAIAEYERAPQITKRLNQSKTPTPSGKNQVRQANTVRNILTNCTCSGTACYNHRQGVIPNGVESQEEAGQKFDAGAVPRQIVRQRLLKQANVGHRAIPFQFWSTESLIARWPDQP
jgi:Recombinase